MAYAGLERLMMSKRNTELGKSMRHGARGLARVLPAIALGLVLAATAGAASAQRVLLDRIVALVDESVVLQS